MTQFAAASLKEPIRLDATTNTPYIKLCDFGAITQAEQIKQLTAKCYAYEFTQQQLQEELEEAKGQNQKLQSEMKVLGQRMQTELTAAKAQTQYYHKQLQQADHSLKEQHSLMWQQQQGNLGAAMACYQRGEAACHMRRSCMFLYQSCCVHTGTRSNGSLSQSYSCVCTLLSSESLNQSYTAASLRHSRRTS